MNDKNFKNLLKRSVAFKKMSAAEQKTIRESTAEQRLNYERIFADEAKLLKEVYDHFQGETEMVVVNYKANVQKEARDQIKNKEEQEKASEAMAVDEILKGI